MNYFTRCLFCVCCNIAILSSGVSADFRVTIPDAEFVSDGVNPTTGMIEVWMEVDGVGSPNVGADISSYNFRLEPTAIAGSLAISSLVPSDGELFDGIPSLGFEFSTFVQGVTPLGYSEGSSSISTPTVPAPAIPNSPIVLTNIAFTVPAGQTGAFSLDFVPDTLQFFDDGTPTPDAYAGVVGVGGTVAISAVPEPSPFVMMCCLGGVAYVRRTWRLPPTRRFFSGTAK